MIFSTRACQTINTLHSSAKEGYTGTERGVLTDILFGLLVIKQVEFCLSCEAFEFPCPSLPKLLSCSLVLTKRTVVGTTQTDQLISLN